MISDKVLELINRDLDGTLTEKEKAELENRLNSEPESKEMLTKLRLIHKSLGEVSQVEPPEELKNSVMRALPAAEHSRKVQQDSIKSNKSKIVDLFTIPRFQMAGMFSLGAAAALLFLVITQNFSLNQSSSSDNLMGTIISHDLTNGAEAIDSKEITISDYNVTVTTSRLDNTVFATFKLSAESNQVIQLTAKSESAENFRFSGLEFDAPNLIYANFGNEFFSAAIAGPGSWLLAFDDPDKTANVLEIDLKTDSESIREVIAIQRNAIP